LHAWSRATFTKIGSKWGEVVDLEESKDDLFARKRICIKTKQEDNIIEKFKIIAKGKNFVIRAKELFSWSPVFNEVKEVEYCTDDESAQGTNEDKGEVSNKVQPNPESDDEGVSDTYFGESEENLGSDISIPYPPGFTPEKLNNNANVHEVKDMNTEPFEYRSEGLCSRVLEEVQHTADLLSSGVCSNGHMSKKGGSVLEVLDEMIKVRQTMGYTVEGCMKDMENIIGSQGAQDLLMISIYAPQPRTEKRSLWNYIMSLITRWQGDSIVMEDFNEVRSADEHIQLEGYSFSWSHPSASKMSKLDRFLVTEGVISLFPHILAICLDMHLSDRRPILLRDVIADYGATPFRLYHSWLTLSGFEQLFINESKQKAKIQWAIEGDENSKFFNGVINRKRADLAIRGIMVDGEWVDDPRRVKEEFCSHFATRFHAPSGIRNKINFLFPNQLSSDQAFELEKHVSTDEIRTAI
nr:RNA-directed DNA polymerase, eukaryota [Tanacetum cinerariifolium]